MTIFSSRPRKVFLSPALVWLEEKGFSSARREASVWEHTLGVEVEEEVMRMSMEAWKTMTIRPVHKNLFLEFPKYPGRFMLHFDI